MKINYRKIYESHYGPIPNDENGRTYDIHHIDGNHSNNDPTNLKAVTIQEHYDAHYIRKEWYACSLIAFRMQLSPTELSNLATELQLKRVADGTHNMLGASNPVHRKIANGTFHLLSGEIQTKSNKLRVKNGTHNFLGSEFAKKRSKIVLEKGWHTSQRKICCIKCSREVSINAFNQHLISSRCK